MFSQKLRSPYIESPVGFTSGGFKQDFPQYNSHWDAATGVSGYDNHGAYENESDSALSRIYNLGDVKPSLMSPLMPEQSARLNTFTPEMKSQHRLDDLELQVLSSAPSDLSSWSEGEEKPPLVKYDSESSLEHLHSAYFSPEQLSGIGSKSNTGHPHEIAFHHDPLPAYESSQLDPYQFGWRYFSQEAESSSYVDLNEMVDGVFTGNVAPCRLDQEQNKPDITHEHGTDQAAHLPIGLRNALTSSHRTGRSSLDTRVKKFSHSFSASPRVTQAAEFAKPQAESFILNPWPVNTGVGPSANTAQEMNGALRVPLPCLSATDRWNKHTSKYTLSPKVSGDMICTHCDQKFTEVEEYTKHLDEKKVVHDNFCPDMSCAFAALGYRYRWLLRRHICNHHLKDYNNKKLRKNSSGKVTALTDNFLSHVYVCKKTNCSRAFYRSDSLSRHEKLIHSVCGKQKRKERLKLSKCDPKIFE